MEDSRYIVSQEGFLRIKSKGWRHHAIVKTRLFKATMPILTCYFLSTILLYTKQIYKMVTLGDHARETANNLGTHKKMAHQSASS